MAYEVSRFYCCACFIVLGSTIEICGLADLLESVEVDFIPISKEKLLSDIQFRGAISDFHPIKDHIKNADYDPLLIKYNEDDRYGDGNNFEVCPPCSIIRLNTDMHLVGLSARSCRSMD